MKTAAWTLLAGVLGLAAGLSWPRSVDSVTTAGVPPKSRDRQFSDLQLSDRRSLAEIAGSLSPAEWPGFFEKHRRRDPELLSQLWAEADPQGFWDWLRAGKDRLDLEDLGPILLRQWVADDPDAAMQAVLPITDKGLADQLRRLVVDETLDRDLQKGLAFAAAAGDFNRFSHGQRDWIDRNPEAAVRGLAALPDGDDYRGFLPIAISQWLQSDPAAALAWLADPPPPGREALTGNWLVGGYRSAAAKDLDGALRAARSIPDPALRGLALSGLLSSGRLPVDLAAEMIRTLPLPLQSRVANDLQEGVRHEGGSFTDAAQVLEMLPANENRLHALESHGRDWAYQDPQAAWEWASSLTEASQRAAVIGIAESLPVEQLGRISQLPRQALSNELFKAALDRLPSPEARQAWLGSLPSGMAAWARQAEEGD